MTRSIHSLGRHFRDAEAKGCFVTALIKDIFPGFPCSTPTKLISRLNLQVENEQQPLFSSEHLVIDPHRTLGICPWQPFPYLCKQICVQGHWEMWQGTNISITMSLVSEVWMEEAIALGELLMNVEHVLRSLWDCEGNHNCKSTSFNFHAFSNISVFLLALSFSFFINYPVTTFPEDSIFH